LKKTATDLTAGAAPFSTPFLDDARAVTLDETPVILVQEDAAMAPPKTEKRNKKTKNRPGFLAIAHVQSAMQPGNKRNGSLQSPVVKNLLCAATVAAAT
jgi:flagellar basal body L-ring protein FlgH